MTDLVTPVTTVEDTEPGHRTPPLPDRADLDAVLDGYRRELGGRADVLIGGGRRRVAGVVTMDQLLVDCGDAEVAPGDEVVLIGAQGDERITAEEILRHRDADRR